MATTTGGGKQTDKLEYVYDMRHRVLRTQRRLARSLPVTIDLVLTCSSGQPPSITIASQRTGGG